MGMSCWYEKEIAGLKEKISEQDEKLRKLESNSLSRAELKLLTSLLALYRVSYEDVNHNRSCTCTMCVAVESAGSHDAATFDSLTQKANA